VAKVRSSLIVVLVLSSALTAAAEPFGEGWAEQWTAVQGEAEGRRMPDGALDIDTAPSQHIYWFGGEQMHDYAVTARVKFLRADDKYSGFSLFMRWNGTVWGERDGYWIYLRPRFRSLYMSKVMDGKLSPEFDDYIEAVRPEATPLDEWMTLRAEVRGTRIEVYLDDRLCLSATDQSLFPILSGRVAFGVGNAHVIIADLQQTNLEEEERIEVAGYTYVKPPNRGDEGRTVLTDGQVNERERQAFWRMLGDTPEIVFDLGGEYFVTRAVLRAFSSPAVNISSADVLVSDDGEAWRTVASLRNQDTRRADAEHEIAGDVRAITRYLKLILNRPAADQDIELAEVELYGRPPTDADREAAQVAVYDTGSPMPETTDAEGEDEHYWYLQSEIARFAIDREHGLVGGVWSREHDTKVMERLSDSYYLYTRDGDTEADEYGDEITAVVEQTPTMLRLRCRNPALPQIAIEKIYTVSPDGRRLIKRLGFTNTGHAPDRFITHQTGGIAAEDFRRGGVYMGCDRGLGARLFADEVTVPRQIGALGARNSKTVILHRYDLGWGVGQFRHQINDRWCRPLTSRWHERENHPPIYLPNGWRFGVATLHLAPGEQQSTEVQFALYNGRQIDFYRMWRFLPETAAVWASVTRPTWQTEMKTTARIGVERLAGRPDGAADLEPAMLGPNCALAMTDTGVLWHLAQIHGVWGEWYSEGIVEDGTGAKMNTQWLRELHDTLHAVSPRIKTGVYTWAWAVHPRSRVYQEHPEWFITTDRSGQVFNAYSNMVLNHARRFGIPESMDELIGQFAELMRAFDSDYFYLDGGGGGQNLIDWEHLGCDQDYHYEELYRRIREVTRVLGDDRAVWFNARTGPWWDIGYYEGVDRDLNASTWRRSADGLSIVKMRQSFDPDQVVVPLYWRPDTLPFYSNYCIGLGITPAEPLGMPNLRLKLPFIEAAYETRRMQWVEADLQPDWRVDPNTEIEAYALRHGDAAVISVIDHREDTGSATVSANTGALGLQPGQPAYVWVYANRDIREAWPSLPEQMRRDIYRETGWGLDSVGRLLDVQVIDRPGERIELSLPTTQHILTLAVISSSPAGIFSVDGLRTNFQAPAALGASVRAETLGDVIRLTADAPEGGAEALVIMPEGRSPVPGAAREILVGETRLAIVPLASGNSTIDLALRDVPPVADGLAVTCPAEVAAGETLAVGVEGAGERASVCVARDDVILHVAELPVVDGAISLPIPEQIHAGALDVRVASQVAGGTLRGSATVMVTGDYQPELPDYRLPGGRPIVEVAETDVAARGVHVVGAMTESFDGRNGGQFAMADADALTCGGGTLDAPRTRYGYGYGALELDGARVLTLKVTNTFFDAWNFLRAMPSFKPQYTSTFAGMMVDYHVGDAWGTRVALGLGLINPKREIGRPGWGTGAAPTEYISLGDVINEGRETTMTIDLARWAPEGWDGRVILSAGAENVYPSRRLFVEILEGSDSPEGRDITEGESVGDLYRIRDYAIARAQTPPTIDGKLDDAVWQQAQPATDFGLLGSISRSEEATRAWAAWDDTNLYVAYECPESGRDQLSLSSEKIWTRDAVDTAINPSGDRVVFQQIIIDAGGDMQQFSKGLDGRSVTWDVRHAVGSYDGGWIVEMAVSWASMGVEPSPGMAFTGNFVRYRPYPPVDEMQTWSPMPGPAINDPERFANFTLE